MNFFKYIFTLSALLFVLATSALAAKVYSPNTNRSMTSSKTFCQGASSSNISYKYYTCNTGSGSSSGISMTISWYANATNSNVGGTLVYSTTATSTTSSSGTITYAPSTATAGTYYYYCVLTWSGSGSCNASGSLTSATCRVTVGEAPTAITGSNTVCVGNTTTLTNGASGGTWKSSSTSRATVGTSTGVVTGVSTGTTRITYTSSCGSRVYQVMTVGTTTTLAANTGGTSIICVGSTSTLSNSTSGGTWTSDNTAVATVNSSTGVVTGVSSGTATISYTKVGTCNTDYATTIVTVTTTPASISGSAVTCNGYDLTYSNSVPYGTWSSTNGTVATVNPTTGAVDAIATGTTIISYTTGCGTAASQTLTVNSGPSATTGTFYICAGSTTTLSNSTSGGTWSSSNTAIATINATTGLMTGISNGKATISYVNGTCSAVKTVTIAATPAAITGSSTACTGTASVLANTILYGTWTSTNTAVATVGTTGTITPLSGGTTTISYNTGCGTAVSKTVTVYAQPAAITGTTEVCVGATTTLANSVSGGTWSSSLPSVATINSTGTVTGVSDGTATITYTNGTCFATTVVTVNPLPNSGVLSSDSSMCLGDASVVTTTSSDDGTWSSSNGSVISIDLNGNTSADAAGTSTISFTVTNGCGTSVATFDISVSNPANAGTIAGSSTVCPSSTITLSTAGTDGTWSSTNTAAATINASGVVTGVASGTTTISYYVSNACGTDLDTKVVTINALPGAGTITGTATACAGYTTALSDATSGGVWSSANTSVATVGTNGIVTGVAAGTATISYTVTNVCGSVAATTVVTINTTPMAISGTASVCVGSTTALSDVTGGLTQWTSSNTAIATVGTSTGIVSGIAAGTARITYNIYNGCFATKVVTVNTTPSAISGSASVCSGATTTYSATPAGGTWASSNTAVATIGSATGISNAVIGGLTTISYTLSTGCQSTLATSVTNTPAAITGTQTVCAGSSTTLSSTTSGQVWSSANTSVATVNTSGVVSGITTGTATISYTAGGTCARTAVVTVNAAVSANTGTTTICAGLTSTLSNSTSGGTWTSSNTGIATVNAASGLVTGVSAGTSNITYTLPSGCYAVSTVTVNAAMSSISGGTSVCVGSTATLTHSITGGTWSSSNTAKATIDASTGVVTGMSNGATTITYALSGSCYKTLSYTVYAAPVAITGASSVCTGANTTLSCASGSGTWSTSNAAIATVNATSGSVSGITAGTATITFTVTATGCYTTKDITVNAVPSAISGGNFICTGNTLSLSATPAGGTWSSTSTAVATVDASGNVTPVTGGSTNISYTLSTGCSTGLAVTVGSTPAAITGTPIACEGNTTILSSVTSGQVWSSSNTSIATINTSGVVTGVAAGTVSISYTHSSGCTRTVIASVNPAPNAGTISGSSTICEAATTAFTNAVSGGIWSSANTAIATIGTDGTVSGVAAGNTTISYSYTNSCGTAYATKTLTVNPLPHAGALSGATSICEATSTSFSSTVSGGTWSSANTAIATIGTDGTATAVAAGNTTISYSYTNSCGTDYATKALTVNPLPYAGTLSGAASICEAATTSIASTVSGGTWSSTNASVATIGTNGTITAIAAGTTTISYTYTTVCGTDYATKSLTVNPLPHAGTISGANTICEAATTSLSSTIGGGVWSSSNTAVATVGTDGTVVAVTAGNASVSYAYTNSCGTDYATQTLTVNPLPHAGTLSGASSICATATTTLSSTVSGGAWSSSNTGVATIGTNGTATAVSAGNTTISYAYTNTCGTDYATKTLTVNAVPAISGTPSICVGNTFTFTTSLSDSIIWTSANPSVLTIDSTGLVTGLDSGSSVITATSASTGCAATYSATVLPLPNSIVGNTNICPATTTMFTCATPGGTWVSSDTFVAVINTFSGSASTLTGGSATIYYILPTGCQQTSHITVLPRPEAIYGTASVCVGATSTFASYTPGYTWSSDNVSVATVNSTSGLVTGISDGTATISYTHTSGCPRTVVVTVNSTPSLISGDTTVCVGYTGTLAGSSAGTWSSSNIGIVRVGSATGIVTGVSAGTATITFRPTSTGCMSTRAVTAVSSLASISGNNRTCIGQSTTLSHIVSGGTWSSSNTTYATIDTNGVVTGISAGAVTITYTTPSGCYKTMAFTVYSNPGTITGSASVCQGSWMYQYCTGGIAATWTSSNTTVATVNPTAGVVTGISEGTTTLTYTSYTGCYSTREITINPLPAAISGSSFICAGSTGTLTSATTGGTWSSSNTYSAPVNATTGDISAVGGCYATIYYTLPTGCRRTTTVTVGALPAAISGTAIACIGGTTNLTSATGGYTWSSIDTSVATINASTGVASGITTGTTTISYTHANGCARTTTLTVNAVPNAISGSDLLCVGSTTTYTTTSTGGTWSSSNYGAAVINNTTGIAYPMGAGTTTISYKQTGGGCYSTKTITVAATPAAITGSTPVCTDANITLSHATTGGIWTSANTSIATIDSTSGIITGISAGTVAISYFLAPGCYKYTNVIVKARPASISGNSVACAGTTIPLSSSTGGGTWSSSSTANATVSGSGVVTAISAGTSTITYTVTGVGCIATKAVTINAALDAISGTTSACVGNTSTLSHSVTGGTWTSSNTARATVDPTTGVVTGITAGTATISYSIPNGCYKTVTFTVNALPATITGATTICEASTGNLYSGTGGTWSSSNAAIATVGSTNGIITGIAAGTATMTYIVTATGCINTGIVTVNPTPGAISGSTTTCVGGSLALTNSMAGGTWTSSNTSVATINASTGSVSGIALGTSQISYSLPTGCRAKQVITIGNIPSTITGTMAICEGSTTTLSSATAGYNWTSANPAIASVNPTTGVVSGIAAGTATITYSFSAECYRTTQVTVNAAVTPTSGNAEICAGIASALANATTGGTWSTSDYTKATVNTSGVVTGVSAGTANITYTTSPVCFTIKQVTINAALPAISGTAKACVGDASTLSHAYTGGVWSSSNSAVASIDASGNVTAISGGSAVITYTTGAACYKTIVFTANAVPAAISGATQLCEGATTAMTDGTPGLLNWSSSNTSVATIGSGTGSVTGIAAGTATVTYTLYSGCYTTKDITINALPAAISGPGSICAGTSATMGASPAGGTWLSSNTSVAPIDASGNISAITGGNAVIYYTLPTGCRRQTAVTVNNIPASFYGTTVFCKGSAATLSSYSSGYTWSSDNESVATINSAGMITGVNTGTATISYTHTNGCARTAVVTVNTEVNNIAGASTIATGATATLTNATPGGTWSSSNYSSACINATSGLSTGLSAGTTTITYKVSAGCWAVRSLSVVASKSAASETESTATQNASLQVSIFPNPTNGILTINANANGTFRLVDMTGNKVCEVSVNGTATISLAGFNLAAGMYVGQFEGTDGSNASARIMYQP